MSLQDAQGDDFLQELSESAPSKARVVIVDDSEELLFLYRQFLKKEPYKLEFYSKGKEGLAQILLNPPDIVLLDIQMPDISGIEVCERIKQNPRCRQTVVIFLTADSRTETLVEALKTGGEDFLKKPVGGVEMVYRLRTHLSAISYRKKLEEQTTLFRKFVPFEMMNYIHKGQEHLSSKLGHMRDGRFSILFADIRNFTSLTEDFTSEESLNFLNSFFARMEPAIGLFKGFIDKYIGDALMALFEIKENKPLSADACVHAGIRMSEELILYNRFRQSVGLKKIAIGIGINTGPVVLGLIGTDKRMDSTAIGSTVNIAARAEELTKKYKCGLIITQDTLKSLTPTHPFLVRPLGTTAIRGLSERIPVYEVFTGDVYELREEKKSTLEIMRRGVALLEEKKFMEADACFSEAEKKSELDPLPKIMIQETAIRSVDFGEEDSLVLY